MVKKISKDDLAEYICTRFLNMKPGQPVPGFVMKKIELFNYYSPNVVLDTFRQSESDIDYWIENKNFNSDYGKVSYIFAIIDSRIAEVERERIRNEKILERERLSQQEFSDPVLTTGNNVPAKDISDFLEGGDLK